MNLFYMRSLLVKINENICQDKLFWLDGGGAHLCGGSDGVPLGLGLGLGAGSYIPMKCLRKVCPSQVSYEICSQCGTGEVEKWRIPRRSRQGTIKLEV